MLTEVSEKPGRRLWIASSLLFLVLLSIGLVTSAYSSIISSSTVAGGSVTPLVAEDKTLALSNIADAAAASAGVRRGAGEQKRVKARGCRDGVCLDVVSLARSKGLKAGETLPLVFTDSGYWPVLLNSFVAQARVSRNLPAEVGVVCLDDAVVEILRSVGAPPCLRLSQEASDGLENKPGEKKYGDEKDTSLSGDDVEDDVSDFIKGDVLKSVGHSDHMRDLWALRVLELRQLLRAGYGALFFDVDAVWQADLRHARYLGTHSAGTSNENGNNRRTGSTGSSSGIVHAYDVVASRGSFPNDVGNFWGATLCMGLVYFAPTPGGKAVVSRLAARILPGQPFDDQMALNRALLHDAALTWLKPKVNTTVTSASTVGPASVSARQGKESTGKIVELNSGATATKSTMLSSKQRESYLAASKFPSVQTPAAKAAAALAARKAEAVKNATILANQQQQVLPHRHRRGFRRPSTRQRRLSWLGYDQINDGVGGNESVARANHHQYSLRGRPTAATRTLRVASTFAKVVDEQRHERQGEHVRRQLRNRRPLRRATKGVTAGAFLQYTSSKAVDVGVGNINGTEVRVALLAHSTVPRRCEQKVGMGIKQLKRAAALHCYAHKVRMLKCTYGILFSAAYFSLFHVSFPKELSSVSPRSTSPLNSNRVPSLLFSSLLLFRSPPLTRAHVLDPSGQDQRRSSHWLLAASRQRHACWSPRAPTCHSTGYSSSPSSCSICGVEGSQPPNQGE